MENNPEQEECLLNHSQNTRKGGLKTIPFIIVNEACERLASYGLLPNLIIYITTFYHMEAARASILITLWSALSNGLAILGAFISDSYLGRYRAVAIGTISSLIGMIVLWLSTIIPQLRPLPCGPYQLDCNATTAAQLAVILCSFGLISIGAGFVRPCSIAFGADQLENKENPDNERLMDSYFNWFYASVGVAIVLAVTVIVYIQDHFGWQVGFGVPALLMVLAVSVFLIGSPLYKKAKPKGSLFTGLFQVAVAAFRKRHINVQLNYNDDCYYRAPESKLIEPSTDFRYTGQPTGLSTVSRMGIGLFLGIVASALSAITETIRCNKAIDAGFEDDPNGVINMSFMWFAPQLALYGVAEALNVVGQIEFIYSLFPKTMSSFAAALYTFGLAVASLISSLLVSVVDSVTSSGGNTSWLATNINRGHLDYFYWLTTFLCLINFLFYLIVCRFTEHHHDGNSCLFPEAEEEHSKNKRFHGA
ncbi:protein NRT1/ PTR FAMILY 1.2-like isoform X2 [Solanum dulcamara]|uniref:protein NRT1/ PTR FAMILY 1.2-like isoform X2 n=1 Tax=Solanum dulcamara TaxID=45834 RepID=UPI002485AB25|nr:protein NRT1/ PTR FAMILY 1.2-like isoform X2 [Solanum dulcamara]